MNLWLGEFLKLLEPYTHYKTPRHYCPDWVSYSAACVSETISHFTKQAPFATRESVKMSRYPHFFNSDKAEKEIGYQVIGIDSAIREAVGYFRERGMAPAGPMPMQTEEMQAA